MLFQCFLENFLIVSVGVSVLSAEAEPSPLVGSAGGGSTRGVVNTPSVGGSVFCYRVERSVSTVSVTAKASVDYPRCPDG